MLQKLVKNVAAAAGSSSHHQGTILSVIASDVRIVGDIITQGEIQVDGQVDGDITCANLVIGEGARIAGEVTAEQVRVHGELAGKINASVVRIAKSARVIGDVAHESLEIEAGAHVEGHCIHRTGKPKAEPKQIEAKPAKAKDAEADVPA
jgi:cytoskeletal protein CcmA (bactofilin family)